MRRATGCWATIATVAITTGVSVGCGQPQGSPETTRRRGTPAVLSGRVTIDGSSTVLPVSRAMAAAFETVNHGVTVSIESSGTGGGFTKLCTGQVDMIGASRPINARESQDCRSHGIDFIELPIAFDSLSVVVNPQNTFAACLTVPELRKMWEPAAEGKITHWDQIRSSFPPQPLALFGPGPASGTFDYFTLAIVGQERSSRNDYRKSEDDDALVTWVAANPGALGYFGYAYYLENRDKLRPVSIDNGRGCVEPSAQTVSDGTYQPLSRPIFLYVRRTAAERAEARALAAFYVAPEHATEVQRIGYVPLPPATLLSVARRLDKLMTGSVFDGRGSVVGLTADIFRDEDRVKSALVR